MKLQSQHAPTADAAAGSDWALQRADVRASRVRFDWMPAAVFVAIVAATLMFWAAAAPESRVDDGGDYGAFYEPVARTILATGLPVHADGVAATRYPPGYPFALAVLFGFSRATGVAETTVLQIFALCMTALSGLFLYLMARDVWPAGPALLTPLLWAGCPLVLWLSSLETSEMVFCAVLYAACLSFWRAATQPSPVLSKFLLPGVLIGCSMLIRPILIGGGVLLSVVLWLGLSGRLPLRSRAIAIALFLAGTFAAVAPWEAWVYRQSGRFVLLSDGGVPGIRDGLTFATNLKGFRVGVVVPPDVETVMRGIQSQYQSLHTLGDVLSVVREQAREHPTGVLKLFAIKALRSWYGTDSHSREKLVLAIQTIFLAPVVAGAIVSWRRGGSRSRFLLLLIVSLTLYFWAMTILVLSIIRYMVPAMGLLFVLAPGAAIAVQGVTYRSSKWAVQS